MTQKRNSGSFDPYWDVEASRGYIEVEDTEEALTSSILGPDGQPIHYRSQKLGHVGFFKLNERGE